MSTSSGAYRAFKEAALWGCAVCCCVTTFVFYDHISQGLSKIIQYAEDSYRESTIPSGEEKESAGTRALENSTASYNNTSANSSERRVEIKVNKSGHFETEASINGYDIAVMTDTGATVVALTYETADKVGLNPRNLKYTGYTNTANGVAKVAPVLLDKISIGDITVKNVQAIVSEQGKLSVNLLGMSFIRRLSRVEMQNDYLLLIQ